MKNRYVNESNPENSSKSFHFYNLSENFHMGIPVRLYNRKLLNRINQNKRNDE